MYNSLSQILLKIAAPGIPDFYQGTELLDFSLVDPDNRRPVDYKHRQELFESICDLGNDPAKTLLETPEDGRIKLYLIWKTLGLRRQHPDLFQQGEYLPLAVEGAQADHVVAFARKTPTSSMLVIVPRLVVGLLDDFDVPPIGARIWEDTHIVIPFCSCSGKYRNVFTGVDVDSQRSDGFEKIGVAKILAEFPVALCVLG